MSDLIKIDTDTLEERLNCMDAEKDALEDRVKELEAVVETLQNEVEIQREEAQLPTEASDMLDKFMTQDEIIELVNDTLREATISIDV
jgi:predicted nuclease with TOPRIM domain|tara:strand:- start:48 stop:311 length:264 start_codon:yes stop_codon:yes gene_type:complete